MTTEKFESEIKTLEKFFTIYCKDKHKGQFKKRYKINYQDLELNLELELCEECHNLFAYARDRLLECPHEIKPRCRKCPNICYEKDKFKQMAKMMRYSGMKLGMTKAAQRLKKMFMG